MLIDQPQAFALPRCQKLNRIDNSGLRLTHNGR
jgi:hypothetical protein